LKSNEDFRIWWAGFNENGEWIQALSLRASIINRQRTNREHGATTPRSAMETATSTTARRQSRARITPQIRVNENTTQTATSNQQITTTSTITRQQSRTRTRPQRRVIENTTQIAASNQQTQSPTLLADTQVHFLYLFSACEGVSSPTYRCSKTVYY
jgi:hypothetical protein